MKIHEAQTKCGYNSIFTFTQHLIFEMTNNVEFIYLFEFFLDKINDDKKIHANTQDQIRGISNKTTITKL